MKLYFASPVAGICMCSFETGRIMGEITFIFWIILGSIPCRSHLAFSVSAVKLAALKTNTKSLGWTVVAQSV